MAFGIACCALALAYGSGLGGIEAMIFGLLILVGTIFERRYHRTSSFPPGQNWERTKESFTDPASAEHIDVWYNPRNGKRRYVTRKEKPQD